jgi:heat-inducible transcriptional repressor
LSVAIGAEHGFEPLAACALVVAPVAVNGEEVGTIGVLGPTRMNYPKALAAVRLVGDELAERLSRHKSDDLEGSHRAD